MGAEDLVGDRGVVERGDAVADDLVGVSPLARDQDAVAGLGVGQGKGDRGRGGRARPGRGRGGPSRRGSRRRSRWGLRPGGCRRSGRPGRRRLRPPGRARPARLPERRSEVADVGPFGPDHADDPPRGDGPEVGQGRVRSPAVRAWSTRTSNGWPARIGSNRPGIRATDSSPRTTASAEIPCDQATAAAASAWRTIACPPPTRSVTTTSRSNPRRRNRHDPASTRSITAETLACGRRVGSPRSRTSPGAPPG